MLEGDFPEDNYIASTHVLIEDKHTTHPQEWMPTLAVNDGNVGRLPVRVVVVERLAASLSWSFGQAGNERLMH